MDSNVSSPQSLQLPSWTYTAGTIGNGLFKTNNADPGSATTITLSSATASANNSIASILIALAGGFPFIFLTNSVGNTNAFSVSGVTSSGGNAVLTVASLVATEVAWSGKYFVSFGPIGVDTGWTANADVGDKTAVIPSNATIDAMQAALNLVFPGFGDAFVATAEKCKALEAVLATFKFPNT